MKCDFIRVIGMRVDMVQIPSVLEMMEEWIKNRTSGNYIVVANANNAILGNRMEEVRNAARCSSLTVPDGITLVLLARFYGYKLSRRVYGPELMESFCRLAAEKGYTNYFYGGTEEAIEKMRRKLLKKYPDLKIAGYYSPPFRSLTNEETGDKIKKINDEKPDVLWVGLGCPKQEIWMYRNREKLRVPVIVGVGAAFDFYSGIKKQAPKWMRENGLEWFFRLINEPQRLWKRYIIDGTLFIYKAGIEAIMQKYCIMKESRLMRNK